VATYEQIIGEGASGLVSRACWSRSRS